MATHNTASLNWGFEGEREYDSRTELPECYFIEGNIDSGEGAFHVSGKFEYNAIQSPGLEKTVCADCMGTGWYVGLTKTEPCRVCSVANG
jgi:hypothetical protein